MKCPSETCSYSTGEADQMMLHLENVHSEKVESKKQDYAFEAQYYQNSKGFAQVICTAKGDSIEEVTDNLNKLWYYIRKQASEEGIEVMPNDG